MTKLEGNFDEEQLEIELNLLKEADKAKKQFNKDFLKENSYSLCTGIQVERYFAYRTIKTNGTLEESQIENSSQITNCDFYS